MLISRYEFIYAGNGKYHILDMQKKEGDGYNAIEEFDFESAVEAHYLFEFDKMRSFEFEFMKIITGVYNLDYRMYDKEVRMFLNER